MGTALSTCRTSKRAMQREQFDERHGSDRVADRRPRDLADEPDNEPADDHADQQNRRWLDPAPTQRVANAEGTVSGHAAMLVAPGLVVRPRAGTMVGGPLAQLVRALRLHRRCHRFESGRAHVSSFRARDMERANAYVRRADPIMVWLAMIFLVVFTAIVVWQDMPAWSAGRVLGVPGDDLGRLRRRPHHPRHASRTGPSRWLLSHPLDVLAGRCGPPSARSRCSRWSASTRFRNGGAGGAHYPRRCHRLAYCSSGCVRLRVLSAERGQAGSSIETIGDAVWWAFVTFATVGYGDMVPVTPRGPRDRHCAHGGWPRAGRGHHGLHRVVVHRAHA